MLLNPGMNVYDIRKPCVGALCYDFSRLDAYIAQPDVRKALGVGDRRQAQLAMPIFKTSCCLLHTMLGCDSCHLGCRRINEDACIECKHSRLGNSLSLCSLHAKSDLVMSKH